MKNKKVKLAVVVGVCLLIMLYLTSRFYGRVLALIKAKEVSITEIYSGQNHPFDQKISNIDGFLEVDFDEAMGRSSDRHFKLYFKHGDGEYNFFKNLYNQNKPSNYKSISKKIPRVIHQIWIGNSPLPTKYGFFQDTVKAQNGDWSYILWDDAKIESEKFSDYDLYAKARTYTEKADIARYMILKKYGGVYIDVDTFCLRSLDSLLKYDLFTGLEPHNKSGRVHTANAIIGSVPSHPIINDTLKFIRSNWEEYEAQFERGQLGGEKIENLVRSRTFFPFDASFKKFSMQNSRGVIALPAGYFYPVYYFKGYFNQIRYYSLASHDFSKSKTEIKMFNYADFWALYDEPDPQDKMKFETIKSIFKKQSPDKLSYKASSPIPSIFHIFTENEEEVKNWELRYPGSKVIKWSQASDYSCLRYAYLLKTIENNSEAQLLKKLLILYNFGGVVVDGLTPAQNSNEFAQVLLELNDKYDFYGYLEQNDNKLKISERIIGSRINNHLVERMLLSIKEKPHVSETFNDISYKYIYLGSNLIFSKFYFE